MKEGFIGLFKLVEKYDRLNDLQDYGKEIRKQTLSEVLKWVKKQYTIMPDYDDRFAFKFYKEWLEQKLRETE